MNDKDLFFEYCDSNHIGIDDLLKAVRSKRWFASDLEARRAYFDWRHRNNKDLNMEVLNTPKKEEPKQAKKYIPIPLVSPKQEESERLGRVDQFKLMKKNRELKEKVYDILNPSPTEDIRGNPQLAIDYLLEQGYDHIVVEWFVKGMLNHRIIPYRPRVRVRKDRYVPFRIESKYYDSLKPNVSEKVREMIIKELSKGGQV